MLATFTGLLAIGGAGYPVARTWLGRGSLHEQVVRGLRNARPFEARLSGEFTWTPCAVDSSSRSRGTVCRDEQRYESQSADLVRRIRPADAPATSWSSDQQWSAAVIDLINGAAPARIVSVLDELSAIPPADRTPGLENDLAVAYYARAADDADAWSMFNALDRIEAARDRDSTSAEILFNEALFLERLNLFEQADSAWQLVARNDSKQWAREANAHRARLRARGRPSAFGIDRRPLDAVILEDRQGAREYALGDGLKAWASGVAAHSGSVAAIRATIDTIAAILERESGDSSVAHVAATLHSNSSRVAAGALALAAGAADFGVGRNDSASRGFQRAEDLLRGQNATPLLDWMHIWTASIALYGTQYALADSIYSDAATHAVSRGDVALLARAKWGLALSAAWQGKIATSLDNYVAAGSLFHKLSEPSNEAAMLSQGSDVMYQMGRDDEALFAKTRAVAAFAARQVPGTRTGPLLALARQLGDAGLDYASRVIMREAVTSAAASVRLPTYAEALLRLAEAEFTNGSSLRGAITLNRARDVERQISDTIARNAILMEIAAADAARLESSEPRRAVERLDEVTSFYRKRQIRFSFVRPLIKAAVLRLQIGDTAGALSNLGEARSTIEAEAPKVSDPVSLRTIAATRRDLFAIETELALTRGDTLGAFLMTERGHGNYITSVPRLGRDHLVLSFARLPSSAVVFGIANGRLRARNIARSVDSLQSDIIRLRALLQHGGDTVAVRAVSATLSRALLYPMRDILNSARALTVVADAPFDRIPYALLTDTVGRFLIETMTLVRSDAVRSPRADVRSDGPFVVVGNPAFDRQVFPELAPLADADREARLVAQRYHGSRLLSGGDATKAAVVSALQSARGLHFAGHARLVERAPDFSHIVLARAAGGIAENSLSAAEIRRLDLRRLSLAVLSSCGTSQRNSARDENARGLAGAFLEAGAGAVVSSLWEVPDQPTAELMAFMSTRLAAGDSPAKALQQAQLGQVRTSARTSWSWAIFVVESR